MKCNVLHSRLLLSLGVSVYKLYWSTSGKWFEIKQPFLHHLVGDKEKPSNDVFGDVVAHNLDLRFDGQRIESRPIP